MGSRTSEEEFASEGTYFVLEIGEQRIEPDFGAKTLLDTRADIFWAACLP